MYSNYRSTSTWTITPMSYLSSPCMKVPIYKFWAKLLATNALQHPLHAIFAFSRQHIWQVHVLPAFWAKDGRWIWIFHAFKPPYRPFVQNIRSIETSVQKTCNFWVYMYPKYKYTSASNVKSVSYLSSPCMKVPIYKFWVKLLATNALQHPLHAIFAFSRQYIWQVHVLPAFWLKNERRIRISHALKPPNPSLV